MVYAAVSPEPDRAGSGRRALPPPRVAPPDVSALYSTVNKRGAGGPSANPESLESSAEALALYQPLGGAEEVSEELYATLDGGAADGASQIGVGPARGPRHWVARDATNAEHIDAGTAAPAAGRVGEEAAFDYGELECELDSGDEYVPTDFSVAWYASGMPPARRIASA